jgi:hypothetical protein
VPLKKSAILLLLLLLSSVAILVYSAGSGAKGKRAASPYPQNCTPLECSQEVKDVAPANGFPSYLLF